MSNDDLDEIRSGDPTRTVDTPAGKHLQQIGPYRILRTIGEGGMGIVYEAEQVAPLVRRIALKLIKVPIIPLGGFDF